MRLRSKMIVGGLGACALAVLALIVVIQIKSSPSAVLKRDLNIAALPASIRNLQMGSDEWQDVIHCFRFTLDPADYTKILAGREYEVVSWDVPMKAQTIHIVPAFSLTCSNYYQWEAAPRKCTIYISDARDEVIIWYSVRLTGT